jgi:hypothetical protein
MCSITQRVFAGCTSRSLVAQIVQHAYDGSKSTIAEAVERLPGCSSMESSIDVSPTDQFAMSVRCSKRGAVKEPMHKRPVNLQAADIILKSHCKVCL